jgi:hypothetical protein
MSTNNYRTISNLAPTNTTPNGISLPQSRPRLHPFVILIICFIILLIIFLVILWLVKPAFLLRYDCNGEPIPGVIDQCRLWLSSGVAALLITFIIGIVLAFKSNPYY